LELFSPELLFDDVHFVETAGFDGLMVLPFLSFFELVLLIVLYPGVL
jgi:hypothetical protein